MIFCFFGLHALAKDGKKTANQIYHSVEIEILGRAAPLFQAVSMQKLEVVKALLKKGADVNARDFGKRTPLFEAVRSSRLDIVKTLLDKGAEVNARDFGGETPLFKASRRYDRDIIKALLDRGADVNAGDSIGLTPLMIAAAKRNLDLAKLLIEKGAEVNAKDWGNFTALSYALHGALLHPPDEMIILLKDHGAIEVQEAPRGFIYWATRMSRASGGMGGRDRPRHMVTRDYGKIFIPLFPLASAQIVRFRQNSPISVG